MRPLTAAQIVIALTRPQRYALMTGAHGDVAAKLPTIRALRGLGLVGPSQPNFPRHAPLTVEGQKALALMMSAREWSDVHAEAIAEDEARRPIVVADGLTLTCKGNAVQVGDKLRNRNGWVVTVRDVSALTPDRFGRLVYVDTTLGTTLHVSVNEFDGLSWQAPATPATFPRYQVHKLGFRYYAVRDTQAGRNVRTMMGDAQAEARAIAAAAELNAGGGTR